MSAPEWKSPGSPPDDSRRVLLMIGHAGDGNFHRVEVQVGQHFTTDGTWDFDESVAYESHFVVLGWMEIPAIPPKDVLRKFVGELADGIEAAEQGA